jgi:hypothetical protein
MDSLQRTDVAGPAAVPFQSRLMPVIRSRLVANNLRVTRNSRVRFGAKDRIYATATANQKLSLLSTPFVKFQTPSYPTTATQVSYVQILQTLSTTGSVYSRNQWFFSEIANPTMEVPCRLCICGSSRVAFFLKSSQ